MTRGGGRGGFGDASLQAGGGGGGWGSGAGGAGAQDVKASTNCVTGGGGGGASLAAPSSTVCAAAPTSAPPNPNGDTGWVQMTFDLDACAAASESSADPSQDGAAETDPDRKRTWRHRGRHRDE